jgi:hypothetical protein
MHEKRNPFIFTSRFHAVSHTKAVCFKHVFSWIVS